MEVYLLIAVIALAIYLQPMVRLLFKRLTMRRKLIAFCRQAGYSLHPTHRFWFFGRRMGRSCDFYVETLDAVYAVKLFGVDKRGRYLIFTQDGTFQVRKFLNFFSYGGRARFFRDTKSRRLPDYDFRVGFRDEWYLKNIHPILLLNPTCIEIRLSQMGRERVIGNGEAISGMILYTLSGFLGELEHFHE